MDRDGVETQVIFGPIFQISTDDPVLRVGLLPRLQRLASRFLHGGARPADRRADAAGDARRPQLTELSRLAAKGGVRQVTLMIANINPKLDDPAWEPLWTALEETGIILSWHITVFVGKPSDRAAGKAASVFENTKFFMANFLEPFVDLFAWGILERHPKLNMVMAEAGTGWLPWLVAGARLPPLAALGGQGVLGRQGRQRARNQAERVVQAADLRDLPGGPRRRCR